MKERGAVITGGARNIGQAIAHRLQEDGSRVFVLDIEKPEVASLQAGARVIDLSDAVATRALAKYLGETHPVTCLVNYVGIVRPAWFDEATIEDFDALMHLNVRAALICAQAVVPSMRRLGAGRIVMNASRVILGKEARTVYSATKGALQSMARTWALELAKSRITVNCVAPSPIATTAFWQKNDPDSPQSKHIIDGGLVGRIGTPEDVANAVSFFCDDRASFVTGQTLFVCGGVTVDRSTPVK